MASRRARRLTSKQSPSDHGRQTREDGAGHVVHAEPAHGSNVTQRCPEPQSDVLAHAPSATHAARDGCGEPQPGTTQWQPPSAAHAKTSLAAAQRAPWVGAASTATSGAISPVRAPHAVASASARTRARARASARTARV
jgi:hypothetical protein